MAEVEYNADELVAPTWLNEQFFKQVLDKNSAEADYKIFELTITPASQKGDHYASIMFRANVVYGSNENEKLSSSMIVKTLPPSDTEKGAILSNAQIFQTELKMYETVIPRFEQEWQRCGERVKFAGNMLYYSLQTPQPVIVLEDLCTAGYDVLRERPYNYAEVKLCLHKLAQWHAVSYKLAKQQPADADVTQLQYGLFRSANLVGSDFLQNGMKVMIAALEEVGGFEQFLPKLRKLAPQLIERCVALNDAYANGVVGPIYVLTHGDFHGRNIMVKRNAGDSECAFEELLFIDFQICFIGTSSYDLMYAAFTLFSKELREEKCNELYHYYFEQFLASLEKLKVPKPWPDFTDLQQDLERWHCFELYLVSTFLPLIMLDTPCPEDAEIPLKEIDINRIFSSSEYRLKFYKRSNYLTCLKELLSKYLEAGYLD